MPMYNILYIFVNNFQMVIATGAVITVNEADISPDIQPVGPRATPVPIKNNPSPSTTPTHRDMAGT